jgi:two-component system, NarL family, response regulator LiaR
MMTGQRIRLLVVDHHAVVCSGLSAILDGYPDFHVIGHGQNAAEAIHLCTQYHPDVICIDISLPGETSGVEVIHKMHQINALTRIVVLTNLAEGSIVYQAMQAGATSYLLKSISADELADAIRDAHQGQSTLSPEITQVLIHTLSTQSAGEPHLTPREYQILSLIAQGQANREIAKELNVSVFTVQFHVKNILAKLGVHNRIEAATFAVRQGMGGPLT